MPSHEPNWRWVERVRRVGKRMVPVSLKLSLPFLYALRDFAKEQQPRKISQSVAIETLMLHASPRLRELYRQYEKLEEPVKPSQSWWPTTSARTTRPS